MSRRGRRAAAWRWLGRLCRWALAAVFLYAGVSKALEPTGMAVAIKNYQLLPWWLVHPVAIVLPWLEIVAGVLLLAGVWLVEAVAIVTLLLLVFIGGSGWAIWQQLDIECGCFAGDSKAGWLTIGRNTSFLLAAAISLVAARLEAGVRADSVVEAPAGASRSGS